MISTQRLIVTMLMFSLMLSIATQLYTSIGNYNNNDADLNINVLTNQIDQQQIGSLNTNQDAFNNDSMYGGVNTENPVQENQPFNVMTWGKTLWDILFYTFVPWPLFAAQDWTQAERFILGVINFFRITLIMLMYLEIFLIWRNKKNS